MYGKTRALRCGGGPCRQRPSPRSPRPRAIDRRSRCRTGSLCQQATPATGSRAAAFNPVALATAALFAAVLSGDFAINGFRNRDLQGKPYPAAATDAAEAPGELTARPALRPRRAAMASSARPKTLASTASIPAVTKPWDPLSASEKQTFPITSATCGPLSCQVWGRNCITPLQSPGGCPTPGST